MSDSWRLIAVALLILVRCDGASAERIKKPPPTPAEAERIASEMAINDNLLQKGDIVVTDRGFLMYRGNAADGVTGDFQAVPNPLSTVRPNFVRSR